jgi:FkbM family methyltransferase
MKMLVKRLLRSAGLDVVLAKNSGTLSLNVLNILKAKRIGCVFDVGANTGQYGRFLRQLGYSGHILSFEPVPNTFGMLEAAAAGDPKWRCFPLALGERAERRTINVYRSGNFTSFLAASDYARGVWPEDVEKSHEETVDVARLDAVYRGLVEGDLPGLDGEACMLKMDTQGFDESVFAGASGILDRVAAIQSEISVIGIYDNMPDGLDTLRLFRDHGFYISGMFPVTRDESLAAIELDCLLVRRDGES